MAISGSYARLHNLLTKLRCLLTRVEGEDGYFEKDLEHEPDTVVLQVARNLANILSQLTGCYRQDVELTALISTTHSRGDCENQAIENS